MHGAFSRVAVAAALLAAVAGCRSSNSTLVHSGAGSITATIDGAAFAAEATTIQVMATSFVVPGSVTISGTQTTTTVSTNLSLQLGYITGPGTYTLGVNESTNTGGTVAVRTLTPTVFSIYTTGFTGSSGTVTITSVTSNVIIGRFDDVTLYPAAGSTELPKHVTNGKFTVPANGFTVAPASTPGSFLNASLGGQPFTGATVVGQGSSTSFGLSASSISPANVTTAVSLTSTGSITASDYPVAPPAGGGAYFTISVTIGDAHYGGQGSDTGSVTITSNSGGRIKGIFSGTFDGLFVSAGSFDVKLPGG